VKRIAGFVYNHATSIIVCVVLVNLVSLISFINFSLDTDFLSSFNQGNQKVEELNELNEKYSTGETISVLIEENDPLLEKANLLRFYKVQERLAAIEGIEQIQSFLPYQISTPAGVISVTENLIETNYETVREFVENKYYLTDQFLSENGRTAIIVVTMKTDADTDKVIDSLKVLQETDSMTISLAGDSIIEETLFDYIVRIIFILPPCAAVLIILVFYSVLRNRKLTVLAMIPAGIAALWTFGTIFWSGQELSLVTALIPIFIIVIGSAYGLHFVSHYQDNAAHYTNKRELLTATMDMTGMPVFLATITTMAGFISLIWTEVVPMQQMGIFVTSGIAYAGFLSLFFVPALLVKSAIPEARPESNGSFIIRMIIKISKKKLPVLAVFATIVIVSAFFIPKLEVVSNQLMFFKENSDIRQTFTKVEENFGSAVPLVGEIKIQGGSTILLDNDFAASVLEMERELEEKDGIQKVISIFDIVAGIYEMTTGREGYPDTPEISAGLSSQISTDDLANWVSSDGLKMTIRTQELTSDEIKTLEGFVDDHSELVRTITGMPVLFDEMNNLVVQSQIQSLGLALALIFIMLWVSLRKITAAFAGVLPIIITICAILGMLAITDFQLNILTATLSAITIGIGVDYSIHVISGIYYYRKQGMDNKESVDSMLTSVSRPVLANAFGLAIGYSAMFFSPLRIHMQAASVMWVAMVVSSLAALLLLSGIYSRNSHKG
jgi:predicted RND superfamily exporter protein